MRNTLLILTVLTFFALPLSASVTTPIFVPGNPTCTALGFNFGFKVDPPVGGTYSIDGINTVTISTDGIYVDWSSTLGMDAVIAKGGPNANVYIYQLPEEAKSDTGLHSPIDPSNGLPFGMNNIEVCFDYELQVTKDVHTSFTRTYQWRIDKSVIPESWQLFMGDSGTSMYTIGVDRTGFTDSSWAANGTITIYNPAPMAATISSISDVISPGISGNLTCGVSFPYQLGAGQTLQCTYQTVLPDGIGRTNTATVTTTGPVGGGSANANVVFGSPTTEVNSTVTVSDSSGSSWQFSDSGAVSYTRSLTCGRDQGMHGSFATIVETGQSDSASVAVQCYSLNISKNAQASLKRTWDWTVEKTADQTQLILSPGQQFLVNYSINITATPRDSDWKAHGDITISNPNPLRGAVINSVSDIMGGVPATLGCGVSFPYLLAPGGSMNCTYTVNMPSAGSGTNVGTAVLQNFSYSPAGEGTPGGTTNFSASASIDFSNALITKVDRCIDVNDSLSGSMGTCCEDETPGTFSYSRYIGPFLWPDQCGDQKVPNTATILAADTGTSLDSKWEVFVNVACDYGCTLTPGYWKTHSQRGPAPYDNNWALLGPEQENTLFFQSGKTYYQVLWQEPAGNAYYMLAHAYIATVLNVLNGTSIPPEVLSAYNEAATLLLTWTPAQIKSKKGEQQPRKRFIELAGVLDMYNKGLLGPGHCSE